MTLETPVPALLFGAKPEVRDGVFVLVGGEIPAQLRQLGSVTTNGVRAVILSKIQADAAGLRYPFAASWITVRIHSSVKASRLTSTVVEALDGAGIRCVVVAGYAHNHLFVPENRTQEALAVLSAMSGGGAFS
jgi:hypothetical protein